MKPTLYRSGINEAILLPMTIITDDIKKINGTNTLHKISHLYVSHQAHEHKYDTLSVCKIDVYTILHICNKTTLFFIPSSYP